MFGSAPLLRMFGFLSRRVAGMADRGHLGPCTRAWVSLSSERLGHNALGSIYVTAPLTKEAVYIIYSRGEANYIW